MVENNDKKQRGILKIKLGFQGGIKKLWAQVALSPTGPWKEYSMFLRGDNYTVTIQEMPLNHDLFVKYRMLTEENEEFMEDNDGLLYIEHASLPRKLSFSSSTAPSRTTSKVIITSGDRPNFIEEGDLIVGIIDTRSILNIPATEFMKIYQAFGKMLKKYNANECIFLAPEPIARKMTFTHGPNGGSEYTGIFKSSYRTLIRETEENIAKGGGAEIFLLLGTSEEYQQIFPRIDLFKKKLCFICTDSNIPTSAPQNHKIIPFRLLLEYYNDSWEKIKPYYAGNPTPHIDARSTQKIIHEQSESGNIDEYIMHLNIGLNLSIMKNSLIESKNHLEMALKQNPNIESAQKVLEGLNNTKQLTSAEFRELFQTIKDDILVGDYGDAAMNSAYYFSFHPKAAEEMVEIGDMYARKADKLNAAQWYRNAMGANGSYDGIYQGLIKLGLDHQDYTMAMSMVEVALMIWPQKIFPYKGAIKSCLMQDDYFNACKWCQAAIIQTPPNPELHAELAGIYAQMGRKKEAKQSLKTAIHMDPNNNEYKKIYKRI